MTGNRKSFWALTSPVAPPANEGRLSERGYFWIGYGIGFANALLFLLAIALLCNLMSWTRS